ncbi:NUDIX hydrolase [Halovenus halobia]|uniref:NUDIX hydrolase n=1 Tax=Halovenus halobia TaxID=3396622 RepID=UPI003F5585F4
METTRHFVATVYVVNDGAVALHEHDKLEMWLPAGGHLDRDELPHEAAKRETREELGLDVELLTPESAELSSETAKSIPKPQHFLLEDINVSNGEVGHQHIDFIYYGRAESKAIEPGPDEAPADAWVWYTPEDLAGNETLPADVREAGQRAIAAVEKLGEAEDSSDRARKERR